MLKWHLMFLTSIYCAVFLTIHSQTIPDMHIISSTLTPWSRYGESGQDFDQETWKRKRDF